MGKFEGTVFLEAYFYESGMAFWTFHGCQLVDMVIPLRINKGNVEGGSFTEFEYVPMLVAIKHEDQMSGAEMIKECNALKEKAERDEFG